MRAFTLVLLLSVAVARADAPPPAAGGEILSIKAGDSSLTYHLVHKFHKVDGVSRKVEGKARILPGGQVQVMVRAPVESFDSANSNRDAHMKETVEAARFPLVELKAVGEGLAAPATFPTTVEKTFKGQLSFHGVQKAIDVPVKLTFEGPGLVKAAASIAVSLEEFKVERPSLMFVKVDDALKIDATLVFAR